jgi:hypothetical protein
MLSHSKRNAETQLELGRVHHQDIVLREPMCRPMVGNRHPCQLTR